MIYTAMIKAPYVKYIIFVTGLVSSIQAFPIEFNTQDVVLGLDGGSYTRQYSMDNVPFVYDTGTTIGLRDAYKFPYKSSWACGGLDAKIDLPVVGNINSQSIYKLTDNVGLIIWAGDTNFGSAKPMSGNNWSDVFHQFCSGSSQGYSVYVKPVILKRSTTGQFNIPFTPIGSIRLRAMNGSIFTGKTEFRFSLNHMLINNEARSCTLQTSPNMVVTLPTISMVSLPHTGNETFGGVADIRLNCEPSVIAYATLTDNTNPANRGDLLTLTKASTATGIGLKIYKNNDVTALKFGPDSPIKRNENQWQLSSVQETSPTVQLKVRYVNTGRNITPGTVIGIATITFSYQ